MSKDVKRVVKKFNPEQKKIYDFGYRRGFIHGLIQGGIILFVGFIAGSIL